MRSRWLILCLLGALALPAGAEEAVPVRRHVIALLSGDGPDARTGDLAHQRLELPLNHCGMVVHRHYIRNGPPPQELLADLRAVVTLFHALTKHQDWLWPWLEEQAKRPGIRFIHFGELHPLDEDPKRLARWLKPFGLGYDDLYAEGPLRVRPKFESKELCNYEAVPRVGFAHRGPWSESKKNHVWVETKDRLNPERTRHPVVTGPWGGIALAPWPITYGSDADDLRWHIDPFVFIREALGVDRVPAPHPSVLNGRRIWFLQIDGDGFESLSTVQPGQYCAKVMLEEVLLRYQLPYTVSIIVRGLTPDLEIEKDTPAMKLAQRILNLPNVEAASHGVLHTLMWRQNLRPDSPPQTIMWYPSLKNYEYSQVNEVKESIRFINERLLTPPKTCRVMLWTGFANPLENVLAAVKEMNCVNLNGGVFRWDPWFDSVGQVTPWSRRVGKELQIYAGAANENTFDGFFTTMPEAFKHVDTTIERSGAGRVLKPADIYFHFYSAEKPARLKSIHTLVQRWGLREPTAPVFASVYSEAVESAVETARVFRTPDGWLLRDFGACRTARIDNEPRSVDWTKSRGLLGARRVRESLYLHLATPDARVVLADDAPRHPHVEEANCLLSRTRLDPRGVVVTATAHNRRIVVVAGFEPGVVLHVRLDGEESEAKADERGRYTVTLEEPGTTRIAVRLR